MKTKFTKISLLGLSIVLASACASSSLRDEKAQKMVSGPTILNPQINSPVVNLNRDLKPSQNPEIIADIKDLTSDIDKVIVRITAADRSDPNMKFLRAPLEIAMSHRAGTTWFAKLSDEDLQKLAVNGQNLNYQISIFARNGHQAISSQTLPETLIVRTQPYMG